MMTDGRSRGSRRRHINMHDQEGSTISRMTQEANTGIRKSPSATQSKHPINAKLGLSRFRHTEIS